MTFNKKTYTYKSYSVLCNIFAQGYFPDDNNSIKGIIQIAHGMAEHHIRYEKFISFLNKNGFAVFINDHLGHGKSVLDNSQLGFFGLKNGYINLVEDMKKLSEIATKEIPNKPIILLGHSMGSFLARLYSERYGEEIDGVIYCGTSGANPASSFGIAITNLFIKAKGTHYRSEFIDNLAFGTYNKKIKNKRTKFDWLTKDDDIVDDYINDNYCGFIFTVCGYRDLMTLLNVINRDDWFTSVPKNLPILLVAGKDDPVGNYGKGVTQVYKKLVDSKHSDVSLKLFDNDRHEILNETDSDDVYKNIIEWINTIV